MLLTANYGEANKVSIRFAISYSNFSKQILTTYIIFRLATNKRVRILALNLRSIKIQTIELDNSPGEVHYIPRIRFKFTLPYGTSYELTRMQYPLRLAYAVSINKSQVTLI